MMQYIWEIFTSKLTKKTDYEKEAEFDANFSMDQKNFKLDE